MKVVKKFLIVSSLVVTSLLSITAHAADEAAIREKLTDMLGLEVDTFADSPVPGLVQVSTNRGLFYISDNGEFLLQARVFNIDENMRNETEVALSSLRLKGSKKWPRLPLRLRQKRKNM